MPAPSTVANTHMDHILLCISLSRSFSTHTHTHTHTSFILPATHPQEELSNGQHTHNTPHLLFLQHASLNSSCSAALAQSTFCNAKRPHNTKRPHLTAKKKYFYTLNLSPATKATKPRNQHSQRKKRTSLLLLDLCVCVCVCVCVRACVCVCVCVCCSNY